MSSLKCCSFTAAMLTLLLTGCTGGEAEGVREQVYRASGRITMEGAPVADAIVSFSPKGSQPAATGRTNANGEYTLTTYSGEDGAAAGDFVVLVVKSPKPADADPDAAHDAEGPDGAMHAAQPGEDESASELPARYKSKEESPLEATVTPDGDNTFSFDLTP